MSQCEYEPPDIRRPAMMFAKYLVMAGALTGGWFAMTAVIQPGQLPLVILVIWGVVNLAVGLYGTAVLIILLDRLWNHPDGRTILGTLCLVGAVGLFASAVAVFLLSPFGPESLGSRLFTYRGQVVMSRMYNLSVAVGLGIAAGSCGTLGLKGIRTSPTPGDNK